MAKREQFIIDDILSQWSGLHDAAEKAEKFLDNFNKIKPIFAGLDALQNRVNNEHGLLAHLMETVNMGEWSISCLIEATAHAVEECTRRVKRRRVDDSGLDQLTLLVGLASDLENNHLYNEDVFSTEVSDSPLLCCIIMRILRVLPRDDATLRDAMEQFAAATRRGLDRDGCADGGSQKVRQKLMSVLLPHILCAIDEAK